ncbi:hypothetical protein HIM_09234 [Hirsutella minnesotensis 3608]|uniref:Uncharacterized protein n=1 Tax=Hirsutella minnesotensis 3608 TaxID=1043627 RepID=A0A0F7ZGR5_9HYPO|nr:hypothetical protein HIM_09234 [Hirsutella minnesotensis 3608]
MFWQDEVTSLIDGVTHITSYLPLSELAESTVIERASKRLKTSSSNYGANQGLQSTRDRETSGPSGIISMVDPKSTATVMNGEDYQWQPHPSQPIVNHSHDASPKRQNWKLPRTSPMLNGTGTTDELWPTVGPPSPRKPSFTDTRTENAAKMRSKVLRYMLARQPKREKDIQRYVQDLTPARLRDLYTTIFDPIGLHHNKLKDAFTDLWCCLESAEAYVMEAELNRSTCMSMEVDREGDYEVKVKVGRHEGLRFIKKYQLLFHTNFELSVTDLL